MISQNASNQFVFIKGSVTVLYSQDDSDHYFQQGTEFLAVSPALRAGEPEDYGHDQLRVLDLGLTKPPKQKIGIRYSFPEKLGTLIVDGLVNGVPLSSYSATLQRAVDALVKFSEFEHQNDTDIQLAIALDEYLGGIGNE